MPSIRPGVRRELFWDEYLVNTSLTGAHLKQHSPQIAEAVMEFDMPWEGDGCNYFSITSQNGIWRMYYLAWRMLADEEADGSPARIRVACIESEDGLHWRRPQLQLRSYPGYGSTNILLDETDGTFDNFHCFIDENPACPPDEKYKATSRCDSSGSLWCFTSPDGYHWKKAWPMSGKGTFDTQNVAFWSAELGKYLCYIRSFHDVPGDDWNAGVRDIRCMTSEDFRSWSDPVLLDFGGSEDIPLYTNAAFRYPDAPQMLVGMPSRYVERREWTENFRQLTGVQERRRRMEFNPRYGLATTDCVLMTSRDGLHWNRGDEAWIDPGIERDRNWVYGDCYPAPGLIRTPSKLSGAPEEYSLYTYEGHWSGKPALLRRYTVRVDGFRSYRADRAPQMLVTKPILYEGGRLSLNFSTSARGYVYVSAKCGKEEIRSCELFGNSLSRIVPFDGDLSAFCGKEITLAFTMSDADLYSMQFVK